MTTTTTTQRKRPPRTPMPRIGTGGINLRTALYGLPPRPGTIRNIPSPR
jgi:hypothetical protein